ncbi:MAG: hypothetical protein HC887_11640, partial [Desulfobacteraceae bacterium]|nr:hypothetical protein [Desulfobacteraceae bacterium]
GSGLTDIGDSLDIGKLRPVYQGKLMSLPSLAILQIPQVPAGTYSLYFGTDTDMNGKLDTDSLVFKAVNVVVGGSDSGSYGGGVYGSVSRSETDKQYYEFPSLDSANLNQPSSAVQADKLVDFIPLQNGYGVRVAESGEQHILRIVPLSDPENGQVLSELALDENPYSGTIANGNMLYLVFSRPTFLSP